MMAGQQQQARTGGKDAGGQVQCSSAYSLRCVCGAFLLLSLSRLSQRACLPYVLEQVER